MSNKHKARIYNVRLELRDENGHLEEPSLGYLNYSVLLLVDNVNNVLVETEDNISVDNLSKPALPLASDIVSMYERLTTVLKSGSTRHNAALEKHGLTRNPELDLNLGRNSPSVRILDQALPWNLEFFMPASSMDKELLYSTQKACSPPHSPGSTDSGYMSFSDLTEMSQSFTSGYLHVVLVEATNVFNANNQRNSQQTEQTKGYLPSCYVRVRYGNIRRKSKVVKNDLNPKFIQTFELKVEVNSPQFLELTLWNNESGNPNKLNLSGK
ncbi:hypothetical protein Ciccas_009899 [Cichlidogyrus casuarinus]|uniref:C2 domain-containing protein n=1 Tax=Cichlidogyrus casuarinus TaxID=1844966 RepID=A0ABD2PVP2_9PLAT